MANLAMPLDSTVIDPNVRSDDGRAYDRVAWQIDGRRFRHSGARRHRSGMQAPSPSISSHATRFEKLPGVQI
jgi:hypothetical protein